MDIQSIKLELIRWLTELRDPEALKQISAIKEGRDWWDDISEEERNSIDIGMAELDSGKGISHEEVIKKVGRKYQL
jgi:predicted transcriptional regulator